MRFAYGIALDVRRGDRVQFVHDHGPVDHLIAVTWEANADVPSGRDDRSVPAEAPADLHDAVLDDENARTRAVAGEAERRVARADVGSRAADVDDLRARTRAPTRRALEIGRARRADIAERRPVAGTGVDRQAGRRLCGVDEVSDRLRREGAVGADGVGAAARRARVGPVLSSDAV